MNLSNKFSEILETELNKENDIIEYFKEDIIYLINKGASINDIYIFFENNFNILNKDTKPEFLKLYFHNNNKTK